MLWLQRGVVCYVVTGGYLHWERGEVSRAAGRLAAAHRAAAHAVRVPLHLERGRLHGELLARQPLARL